MFTALLFNNSRKAKKNNFAKDFGVHVFTLKQKKRKKTII
jgi:hypothetical protein